MAAETKIMTVKGAKSLPEGGPLGLLRLVTLYPSLGQEEESSGASSARDDGLKERGMRGRPPWLLGASNPK